jgi:Ca2+-binding RTX toxin-like protein
MDGGTPSDVMAGGAGNDTYIVDSADDVVIENPGEGRDIIRSSVTYVLPDNIENLLLTGAYIINGTGNALDNQIVGNSVHNVLSGGQGADRMVGGKGDDIYVVDNVLDTVVEYENEGFDTVLSSVSYALGDNVEYLILTGSASIDGLGNNLNNFLDGNPGDNTLGGGAGNDIIRGYDGDDRLYGGIGNDELDGGDDNDILLGESGNDILRGGNGDDFLDGGEGADSLFGGTGNDIYLFSRGFGQDIVDSYDPTAGKLDIVQFGATIAPGDVIASRSGNDLILSVNGTSDTLTIRNYLENGGITPYSVEQIRFHDGTVWDLDAVKSMLDTSSPNRAPQLSQALPDQSATEGVAFSYTIAAGAFTDPDADTLTYSATLADGSPLPAWLGFDATTRTFSGTPSTPSPVSVRVTVEDAGNLTASDVFDITVSVQNLTLNGTANADTLTGGSGNDILNGHGGNDTLIGNAGNDVLDGGAGSDTLRGGAGDDLYVVDDAGDVVTEHAAEGIDTVQSSISYTLGAHVENLTLTGAAAIDGRGNALDNVLRGNGAGSVLHGQEGNDTLHAGNMDTAHGGDGDDLLLAENAKGSWAYLWGDAGDDTLMGGAGPAALWGGAGNDTITGGAGDNYIWGDDFGTGTGDDVIYGGNGYDFVSAGGGNDIVYGNGGDDYLSGNEGDDTLHGGAGNDVLDGGAGSDTLRGGAGDDLYVVDDAGDVVTEHAAEGIDTVQSSISYTLGAHVENLTLTGAAAIDGRGNALDNVLRGNGAGSVLHGQEGNDTLHAGNMDTAHGGDGDDLLLAENAKGSWAYLWGDAGDDTLMGGAGPAALWGGAGNDTITGGAGDNYIWGDDFGTGTGDDVIYGGNGYDFVSAGGGNDIVYGNGGDDYLSGNEGDDTLHGGAGNDVLDGGAGSDTLRGGAGDDLYVVDDAGDVVTEHAAEGIDTVQSSISYTLGAHVENLTLTGAAAIDGTGNALDNVLRGNGAGSVLHGLEGNDTLYAGGGDEAHGGAGNDVLYAENSVGNISTLYGDDGDDVLNGGAGLNFLVGGFGNDIIYGGSGINLIYGDDNVGGPGGDDVILAGAGYNYVWAGAGNDVVIGNAGDDYLMGQEGNDWIYGGAGNDILNGDVGIDTLVGGTGNDTYNMNRGYGVDTVIENDATAGNVDVVQFLAGVSADQIWFQQIGNNLEASIIGTGDKLVIQDWYLGSAHHVEQFKTTGSARTLLDGNVQNLVNAMASFAPPAAGQTTLPQNYQDALAGVIAANWQ